MEKENKSKEKESKEDKVKKAKVKALAKDLPISKKHAVALCAAVRGKKVRNMQKFLRAVIEKKKSVAMKGEIPHRAGTSRPGRYPIKASGCFVKLLGDLVANASVKNLDVENLIITKAIANQASRPYKAARIAYGRRQLKRTHVELEAEAEEVKEKKKVKEKEKVKKEIKEVKKEDKEEVKEAKPSAKSEPKKPVEKVGGEEND